MTCIRYVFLSLGKNAGSNIFAYFYARRNITCVAAMELSVLRAQATLSAHFLFKPGDEI